MSSPSSKGMLMLTTTLGLLASVATADSLPVEVQAMVESGCSIDGNCLRQPSSTHKEQHESNSTQRDGLKMASKGGTDSAEDEDEDPLLQWLNEKMVPEAKACGVWLAPSTIPGAGLGMFAGRAYKPQEIVTEGDIVIPLSEIDWHNGFQLNFFLWEEYTWR
jgi:hypothetical protein